MTDCIFCKIVTRQIQTEVLFEDESVMAFYDINPSAEVHILIIPKKHIETVLDISENDAGILYSLIRAAQVLVKKNNLDKIKYRLIFNGGLAQHVKHIHLHLLGGNFLKSPE